MRIVLKLELTMTIDVLTDEQSVSSDEQLHTNAVCVHCGWRRIYSSPASARRGLAAHMRFCPEVNLTAKRMFQQLVSE